MTATTTKSNQSELGDVIAAVAGHGGIFQYHQQFVEHTLAFLGRNS